MECGVSFDTDSGDLVTPHKISSQLLVFGRKTLSRPKDVPHHI